MKNTGRFFSGTSGMVFTEPNKKAFPPAFQETSRLTYYASLFNSLEVNSSFYKIPQRKTCIRWSESVPEHFVFTIKLWKGFTHEEQYKEEDLYRFMESVNGLGNKKGSLLIQYPVKTRIAYERHVKLLEQIRTLDPESSWRIAIEIRNESWLGERYFQLLKDLNAALVAHDKGNYLIPKIPSSFLYLRYHGPTGNYNGSYSESFLHEQAVVVKQHLENGEDVYMYFNNTIGDAFRNLRTLQSMIPG